MVEGVAAAFDVELDLELKQRRLPACGKPTRVSQRTHGLFSWGKMWTWLISCQRWQEKTLAFLSKVPGVMFWLGIDTLMPCTIRRWAKWGCSSFAVENIVNFFENEGQPIRDWFNSSGVGFLLVCKLFGCFIKKNDTIKLYKRVREWRKHYGNHSSHERAARIMKTQADEQLTQRLLELPAFQEAKTSNPSVLWPRIFHSWLIQVALNWKTRRVSGYLSTRSDGICEYDPDILEKRFGLLEPNEQARLWIKQRLIWSMYRAWSSSQKATELAMAVAIMIVI